MYRARRATLCTLFVFVALTLQSPSTAAGADSERSSAPANESPPPPVSISGHAMFRYTWSLDPRTPNGAEIYNLRLYLDRSFDGITLHAEPRFRQTPLRSFSPSNVWIQQAWVAFDRYAASLGTLRAGLIYTRPGLSWDRSWFGNLVYLDGHKLDPDYGVELHGAPSVPAGPLELSFVYGAQYIPLEDGLNGFYAPPSKLDRLGATAAGGWPIDFDSAPGYTERHLLVGELGPRVTFRDAALRVGGVVATKKLHRSATQSYDEAEGRGTSWGVDGEARLGGFSLYGEWLRHRSTGFDGPTAEGSRHTDYLLGGAALQWRRDARWLRSIEVRANSSFTEYRYAETDQWFVAPGVHARLHPLLGVTAEYVHWEFDDEEVVDRIEWIIHGYF